MAGDVWNGLLLGMVRWEPVPYRFCGEADNDWHFFWDCTLCSFSLPSVYLSL